MCPRCRDVRGAVESSCPPSQSEPLEQSRYPSDTRRLVLDVAMWTSLRARRRLYWGAEVAAAGTDATISCRAATWSR